MEQLELLSLSRQQSYEPQPLPNNDEAVEKIRGLQDMENHTSEVEQLELFSVPLQQSYEPQPLPNNDEAVEKIRGLQYIKNYISEADHRWLLARVDEQHWLGDLKRRVQHYGFKYDYRARKVSHDMRIGELPKWLGLPVIYKLEKEKYMPRGIDQVIINEYQPGQGISSHIDCEPCFQDTIVSLSLGSGCVMNFTNKFDKTKKIPVWLAPRSLVVLNGEARYEWLHGIAARKWDEWDGHKYMRERRVSLTFRKVIIKTAKGYKDKRPQPNPTPLKKIARSRDRAA